MSDDLESILDRAKAKSNVLRMDYEPSSGWIIHIISEDYKVLATGRSHISLLDAARIALEKQSAK